MTGSPICSMRGIAGRDTGSVMRTLAIVIALLAATGTAEAADIDAFISTAIKSVTDEILPPFERASGHTIHALYAPPGALLRHFAAGEPADVFLTGSEAIDTLIGDGKVLPGRVDLATTGIGICVRKGAPAPDVSTPEAFKRVLLKAASVAYVAPSGGSVTGPHIEAMFRRLGIAEQMAAKTKLAAGGPDGRVSVLVSSGEAEIGLQQVSELLTNPGVTVIGMLPADLQQTTIYSAGITTSAKQADAARALIEAFSAPSAKPIFKAKGLDPL
jgi:molybdate transport system substrate-binding protein